MLQTLIEQSASFKERTQDRLRSKERLGMGFPNPKKSRRRQLDFFNNKSIYAAKRQLGGANMSSHPKRKRPISTRDENHVVMASRMAKGDHSMRKSSHSRKIKTLVYQIANSCAVSVVRFENVGNHLHLLIRVKSHEAYTQFIRGLSAAISRHMTGAKRGSPKKMKFWDGRPFTRIVTWGKDRMGLLKYLNGNRIQAVGFQVFIREEEIGYKLTG